MIHWFYLALAGLFEIGWPIGLKISQTGQPSPSRVAFGLSMAAVCMAVSGFLLWVAQREIPVGTAYAIWTGIGAIGTFVIGILFYGDSTNVWRLVSMTFLVMGIVGLKLSHA